MPTTITGGYRFRSMTSRLLYSDGTEVKDADIARFGKAQGINEAIVEFVDAGTAVISGGILGEDGLFGGKWTFALHESWPNEPTAYLTRPATERIIERLTLHQLAPV